MTYRSSVAVSIALIFSPYHTFVLLSSKKVNGAGQFKSPHEVRNDGMAPAPRHDDRKGRHYYTTSHARYACRI